jgi:hypothetical protein
MICISVDLVAGPNHKVYAAGKSLAALVFVRAASVEDAEFMASEELSVRGWSTMAITRYKTITDYEQFGRTDLVLAESFQDALESGFSVVVYP